AHGQHRLEPGVEPRGQVATGRELGDVEHGRVAEVEDQRVPQRLMPLVVRSVVANQCEEPLVDLAGLMEIPADVRPLRGHPGDGAQGRGGPLPPAPAALRGLAARGRGRPPLRTRPLHRGRAGAALRRVRRGRPQPLLEAARPADRHRLRQHRPRQPVLQPRGHRHDGLLE
ncbi:MAG: hypothetical protein ACK55I_50070, partial [bacterium]